MNMKEIRVFAPATVANVACGYDVLGFALHDIGDELIIRTKSTPGLFISEISGTRHLSRDPGENVVTVAAQALLDNLQTPLSGGFEFHIIKKVEPGSGLGSSASSAAAAVFGLNELLGTPFSRSELVSFAMEGERLASGIAHADNVAPSLLGGFTLVRSYQPLDVVSLEFPDDLCATVIHPRIEIKTSEAKKMLRKQIELKDAITQWGNIAALVSGLAKPDYDLIGRSLHDVIAEPIRGMLIPSFLEAKQAALQCGALGCSISGSGPSIFALSRGKEMAHKVEKGFKGVFEGTGVEYYTHVSPINETGCEVLS